MYEEGQDCRIDAGALEKNIQDDDDDWLKKVQEQKTCVEMMVISSSWRS